MAKSYRTWFTKPLPTWLLYTTRFFQIFWDDLARCDVFKHASAMAYVTLLSLIPSLAAIFTIVSLFQPILGENSGVINELKNTLLDNLAAGSGDKVVEYLDHFISNLSLGKIGTTGFVGVTVSLVLLLRQIEIALNRIWLVDQTRNSFSRFIYFTAFLMISTFILGIALGVFADGDLSSLNPFNMQVSHRSTAAMLAPKLATLAFFVALYKVVPNRLVRFQHALMGAIPATLALSMASQFYGSFTSSFTNYTAIYGALAAIPVFLLWLYVVWTITLVGGVIAWRAEQGFHLRHERPRQLTDGNATDRHRSYIIQHWLPVVCLLAIYHRYMGGSGKGIKGQELADHLCIPPAWVCDALHHLREQNKIVTIDNAQQTAPRTDIDKTYFPALPPDALYMSDLEELMHTPYREWLKNWSPNWDFDAKLLLQILVDHQYATPDTISALLKKVSHPASS